MDEIARTLSTWLDREITDAIWGGSIMDKALYDRGMAMRRKVLGDEYVDRAVANTDDFNRQFQELLTTYCWGAVWGDDALKPRERRPRDDRLPRPDARVRGAFSGRATERAYAERAI